MGAVAESFAMVLYRRFCDGETVEQLAAAFEIPEERIECRIRAAALCEERQRATAGLLVLHSNLA
jgi:hypothetical protein